MTIDEIRTRSLTASTTETIAALIEYVAERENRTGYELACDYRDRLAAAESLIAKIQQQTTAYRAGK